VAAALLAGTAGVSYADDYAPAGPVVPPTLVPPAGNVLAAAHQAQGVQIYQCTAGAWTFVEPAATLQDRRARAVIIHFRGPSWQSIHDGSLVEAAAAANSPVPGSIPELLLKATRNRGDGALGKVTFVQRLATRGGTAPAGACTAGAVTSVPYQALYRFFVAG
jgi:hypothetical protein